MDHTLESVSRTKVAANIVQPSVRRTAIKANIESSLDYLLDDNFRVSIFWFC
jgi:hypothetical protein